MPKYWVRVWILGDTQLLEENVLTEEEFKNFSAPIGTRVTYEEIDMGKFVPKTDSPDGHNNSKEHYEEAKQVRNTDKQADAESTKDSSSDSEE